MILLLHFPKSSGKKNRKKGLFNLKIGVDMSAVE